MKNFMNALSLSLLALTAGTLRAYDGPIKVDVSGALSFGVYPSGGTLVSDVEKWSKTLLSLRGPIYLGVLYELSDFLLIGGEVGYSTMSLRATMDTSNVLKVQFRDIPVRGAVRLNLGKYFFQPYMGVYLASAKGDVMEQIKGTNPNFELGIKGGKFNSFWIIDYGYFTELSMIMGPSRSLRAGIGFVVKLLK